MNESESIERLHSRIVKMDEPCWLIRGWANEKGYARFTFKGAQQRAHRAAYELLVGPIPDGLTIDHLCMNPRCCNPRHLEPVTAEENRRRASQYLRAGQSSRQAAESCVRGHPRNDETVRIDKSGKRICRVCQRDYERTRVRIRVRVRSRKKH